MQYKMVSWGVVGCNLEKCGNEWERRECNRMVWGNKTFYGVMCFMVLLCVIRCNMV